MNVHACSRGEGDEHLETELFPFAVEQVGKPGLADRKKARGLGLIQPFALDELAELRHEVGAYLQNSGLIRRQPQVKKYVAAGIENVIRHRLPSDPFVSLTGHFNVMLGRLLRLLLKRM